MISRALIIPPNYHFLKTLSNFFLSLCSLREEKVLNTFLVFPNKRACLFFKYYLQEKTVDLQAGFFPRILSFEEFIDLLYVKLCENPFPKVSEMHKIFCFLEAVAKFKNFDKSSFERYFEWGLKFLEVFEEFEKEGRVPQKFPYPPEYLPPLAEEIFEDLKNFYLGYQEILKERGYSYLTHRLREVVNILREIASSSAQGLVRDLEELEEVWFIGFAALRKIEQDLFNLIKTLISRTYFIFEGWEPLPQVLKDTLNSLGLKHEFISSFYKEMELDEPEIYFYKTTDVHLEISKAVEFIDKPVERPDRIAIVLGDQDALLPLLYRLEENFSDLEVNISVLHSLDRFLINKLFLNIIQAQKNKKDHLYLASDYLKILSHPYVKKIEFSIPSYLHVIVQEIESFVQEKGYLRIGLEEIERAFPHYQAFLNIFHEVFFRNWEKMVNPKDVSSAIKTTLNLLSPLWKETFEREITLESLVLRNYLEILESKILTFFEEIEIKSIPQDQEILLKILEHFLKTEKISFFGDPLKGLQILGFLETRLLSFDKVIVLDVNEGNLPPSPEFNPLLTEEIKRYFGIPIYRNELWLYYFERLIKSSKKVYLFYLASEKAKTQDFKEPSRFILKLKWDLEREKKAVYESTIQRDLRVFSKKEGIPKDEKVRKYLLKYFQTERISRYFLEIYLKCGAMFYFKYILKLKEPEREGFKIEEIGNFMHEFFERFYKKFLEKDYRIKDIFDEQRFNRLFEKLWEEYEFERKMDPLSHFFSKKIAITSILKYFEYLKTLETKVQQNTLIGLEKELSFKDVITTLDNKKIPINFYGIIDFLIKRKEHYTKYLILDFKSNPDYKPYPRKVMQFIDFFDKKIITDTDFNTLNEVIDKIGRDLYNFQLIFYYYLFYKNKDQFIESNLNFYIINTGFITPSDIKEPEKFLFNFSKLKDWTKVYSFFENKFISFLDWLVNHIIFSDKFYFTEYTKTCKCCPYYMPCKNMMHML